MIGLQRLLRRILLERVEVLLLRLTRLASDAFLFDLVDARCKTDAVWCNKSVRLDVSQARGEPMPTLFVGGVDP